VRPGPIHKERFVQLSLCALLPIYNDESALESMAARCLEILADLAIDFEVLFVDDGSTDATPEYAAELVTRFPQLQVISHPARLGQRAVWETALRVSDADVFFYCGGDARTDARSIALMWPSIHHRDLVVAVRRPTSPLGWIPKLPARSEDDTTSAALANWSSNGCLLTRRKLIEDWLAIPRSTELSDHLSRSSCSCRVLPISDSPASRKPARRVSPGFLKSPDTAPREQSEHRGRTTSGSRRQSRVARPNYVERLRDFALGE